MSQGALSSTLFNIYNVRQSNNRKRPIYICWWYDKSFIHLNTDIGQDNLQPYLQEKHDWTNDNDLILNADKSTSTLFTPDSAEYKIQFRPHINNTQIPIVAHPKILAPTFYLKITYSEHVTQRKNKAIKTTNIIKAPTDTQQGKRRDNHNNIQNNHKTNHRTCKHHMVTHRLKTNMQWLQTAQNIVLRTARKCTTNVSAQHQYEET